ncbi:MAG: discoidin domain-containing protein [Actinomycetota bacterium]
MNCGATAPTVVAESSLFMDESTPQAEPTPPTAPLGAPGQGFPPPVPPAAAPTTAFSPGAPSTPGPGFHAPGLNSPDDGDGSNGSRTAFLAVLAGLGVLAAGVGAFVVTTVIVSDDDQAGGSTSVTTSTTVAETTTTEDDSASTTADSSSSTSSDSSSSSTAPVVPAVIPSSQVTAAASSSLAGSGALTYGPDNLLDGDTDTAWNDDTGAATDGAGQWLQFDLAQPRDLLAVEIVNGYAKSDEVFTRNEAARAVQLTTDTGVVVDAVLDRTTNVQRIGIDAPGASSVTITVIDVYPGQTYQGLAPYTDLALTDVWLIAAG